MKELGEDARKLFQWFSGVRQADMADARMALNWGKVRVETAMDQLKRRGVVERQPMYRVARRAAFTKTGGQGGKKKYNSRTLCDAAQTLLGLLDEYLGWDRDIQLAMEELAAQAEVVRQRNGGAVRRGAEGDLLAHQEA